MSLFQTSSTHVLHSSGVDGVGYIELLYRCDGCETRTGDPDARIAKVIMRRDGTVVDSSAIDDWALFYDESDKPCSRSYCPSCAPSHGDEL